MVEPGVRPSGVTGVTSDHPVELHLERRHHRSGDPLEVSKPAELPWTIGWGPNYQSEARIYAKYVLEEGPNARIAVLYQNDDYGKDYLRGLKDGLGERAASMIAGEDA